MQEKNELEITLNCYIIIQAFHRAQDDDEFMLGTLELKQISPAA